MGLEPQDKLYVVLGRVIGNLEFLHYHVSKTLFMAMGNLEKLSQDEYRQGLCVLVMSMILGYGDAGPS